MFIAILSNKLPPEQQARARRLGLTLALVMRIALLMVIVVMLTIMGLLTVVLGVVLSEVTPTAHEQKRSRTIAAMCRETAFTVAFS